MKSFIDFNYLYELYKPLFHYSQDACYVMDKEGRFKWINHAAKRLTGFSEKDVYGASFVSFIHDDCGEKTLAAFNRLLQGTPETFDTSIYSKTGSRLDLSITAFPLYMEKQVQGLIGIAKDITQKNKLEQLLSGQNKVLEMIAKGSSLTEVLNQIVCFIEEVSNGDVCSILLVDENNTSLIHGASPNLPLPYTNFINGVPIGPDSGSCGTAAFLKQPVIVFDIATDPLWQNYREIALQHELKACWSSPVYDNSKNVIGTFAMYYKNSGILKETDQQIIEKATYLTSLAIQHYRSEEKINFMAYHDELTGLPNRRLFDQKVNAAISTIQKNPDKKLAVLYLDLDRFKLINDSLGHKAGDLLLKKVAKRLQNCLRQEDTSSRQGGDEFAVFLNDVSKQETIQTAQKIIEAMASPYFVEDHEVFITPSIGISFYPSDAKHADELLRKADIAMYEAKKYGRNNFQFYDAFLDKKMQTRLQMENELRKALRKKEFSLHYQPIINLLSGRISGVEALVRWNHPKLGHVSPAQFVPIAEETGMIVPIGEWILQTACRQLKKWQNEGLPLFTVSVNLSIRQFYQPSLISMVSRILNETGVEPRYLMIELTESMTMDVEKATTILHELKQLGVCIAIDDFGTGYSSLSYLKTFPIDYLKIDQSFIHDLAKCEDGETIAVTILSMAQNLRLGVIAEGVETIAQKHFLQKHGCQKAQGFLLSKPLKADELTRFLQQEIKHVTDSVTNKFRFRQ